MFGLCFHSANVANSVGTDEYIFNVQDKEKEQECFL